MSRPPSVPPSAQNRKIWTVVYVVMATLTLIWLQGLFQGSATIDMVPYSQFEQALSEGRIQEVTVSDKTLTGQLKEAINGKTRWVTIRIEPDLATRLDRFKVPYSRVIETTWLRDVLNLILPSLVFFGLWFFLIRRLVGQQGAGSFLNIGKSKAKVYVMQVTGVSFADVAGVDEAKQELMEVVDFLKHPQDYGRLGAHIPKGVLLVGPPGTGKTLLAKAVAGEAGVPFFSMSGSEFVEMFVGVGAARVRDLFEQARLKAPAIIFIDELDALGRARGAFPGLGGHDEKEQTLNQLLAEMDGFDTSSGVIILAATNRPEILDPALLRAGRFDRQVLVDKPDKKGRLDILKVHAQKISLDAQLSLEAVAAITPGFSGADLANLVNEAAIVATRRKANSVTLADFTAAVERIVAGLEKRNRVLNPHERLTVAHHEMGHVLVALALPDSDTVHKVSIIARGIGSLGYTIQRPTEDRYLMTREELERKICVLLGGRAAEKLMLGHLSTGAADDLAKATQIAREMVTRFGMDDDLGCVSHDSNRAISPGMPEVFGNPPTPVSEATLQRMDAAIDRLMTSGLQRAEDILSRNRDLLARCSQELLQQETLDAEALKVLTADLKKEPASE
ncbi:cell division protein FtsH [Limnohabitans sp. T6-5]|uniref:ATP-dependent zinc metalloprotease FtsH n=1 Tax=Limnohabitans sp. T6-5 TaxID=1100724 RepID=UPI000D348820|nr:ATP-dependent zinc metalloprotease FtsH [Limnohabitans sp. T6-5]PUE10936.1 cell division protein FtsH [Limnohabitans sp. T6-5]